MAHRLSDNAKEAWTSAQSTGRATASASSESIPARIPPPKNTLRCNLQRDAISTSAQTHRDPARDPASLVVRPASRPVAYPKELLRENRRRRFRRRQAVLAARRELAARSCSIEETEATVKVITKRLVGLTMFFVYAINILLVVENQTDYIVF